jgi:hypothetical protein
MIDLLQKSQKTTFWDNIRGAPCIPRLIRRWMGNYGLARGYLLIYRSIRQ